MFNAAEEFFGFLSEQGIESQDFEEQIYNWSSEETLDFIYKAYERLSLLDEPSKSRFNFSASASLSGEPFPCRGIACRLSKLDSLARFASLYGDKVYVTNPFEKYLDLNHIDDDRKDELLDDLEGLLYAKPLFRAGIFGIRNDLAACTCKECLRKMGAVDEAFEGRLEKAKSEITREYFSQTKVELDYFEEEPFLVVTGPEYLIEHGAISFSGESLDKIIKKYIKSGQKQLSSKDIKKSGVLDEFISNVTYDLLQQNIHVRYFHTHYITDRSVELNAATLIDTPTIENTSNALLHGLQHSIPTVMDVQLSKLITLRQREGEAFEVYRDNMDKILKQAQGLSAHEAEELIDDTVRPAIHAIEQKLKSSKKLLVGSLKRDMLISVGFVGIGIFSGFVSKDIGAILTAVGGLNFVKDTANMVSQLRTTPETVTDNPYYFLWKLKKTKTRI